MELLFWVVITFLRQFYVRYFEQKILLLILFYLKGPNPIRELFGGTPMLIFYTILFCIDCLVTFVHLAFGNFGD